MCGWDWSGRVVEWIQAISSIVSAVSVIYFTYQLVKNDNARHKREVRHEELEEIIPDIIAAFKAAAPNQHDIAGVAIKFAKKFNTASERKLILVAYTKAFTAYGTGDWPSLEDLKTYLWKNNVDLWDGAW